MKINSEKGKTKKQFIIRFDIKTFSESTWSKFFFDNKEDRDNYLNQLSDILKAEEIEDDLIGKLKLK